VIIYPTHKCFDEALEFCEERARADAPGWQDLILVHGIVLVPDHQPADAEGAPGDPAAHAWVEAGDVVWDSGRLEDGRHVRFSVARAEYYAYWRVQHTTKYTMRAALTENRRTGTYGPWRPEYQALCRRSAARESQE
jgi:hypothetical protein